MGFLQDLYNGQAKFKNYSMPYGGGSYSAAGSTPSYVDPKALAPSTSFQSNAGFTPVSWDGEVGKVDAVTGKMNTAPIFTGGSKTNQTPAAPIKPTVRSKYIDPSTGEYFKTAQDYANYVASKIPTSENMGDVINYSQGYINNPNQSAEQLTDSARNLNNARNDLAVGETNMFRGMDTNQAGEKIIYSPTEQEAIRKAAAGIYDPVLNDVFAKLEAKKKQDEEATIRAWEKEKLALQHGYAMEEKGLTPGGDGSTGGYVIGTNPIVDSYVDRINRNEITEKDAMAQLSGVKNTSLRASISNALALTRNQNVKYTSAMNDVNKINRLVENPELNDMTGLFEQFYPQWATTGTEAEGRALLTDLKSNLQLAKSGSLQGQGAVSDYERSLVSNAATGLLARNLSTEAFKRALLEYRAGLMLMNNESVPVEMAKAGEVHPVVASREDIAQAIKDGWTIKYLQ